MSTEVSPVVSQLCLQYSVTSPTIVNPQLEDLWCLENIGISDPPFGDSDDEALQKFNETVKFDDGRYQVTWPWKNDGFQLSDNYCVAIARMKMLVNRLHTDKDLLHKYDEVIQQQVKNNIIEEVYVTKPSEETQML